MNPVKPKSLTKRLLTSIAIVGLAAYGAGVANANDLSNPDLDNIAVGPQVNASPVGWQITAVKSISGSFSDGADSETFCNVQQPGGYGLFFKPFQGSTNVNPALDDLLTVYFYQDNPSTPGTKVSLSGYAACEPNFCGIEPAPPGGTVPLTLFVVEFLDNGGNILASNAFDLVAHGMPTTGAGSMAQLTTPQYTAPAGTVTVRAGAFLINAYGTSGAQSFFVDAFDEESVAPPGSPAITSQPAAATVALGGNTSFTVATSPLATSYTWSLNGTILTDGGHVSGSSTATLHITGASSADVGHYRVLVANNIGSVFSTIAPLAINGINLFPTITLNGTIGDTYAIQRGPTVTGPFTSFSTNKLTTVPQYIVDFTLPVSPSEFYQEIFLH